MQRISGTVLGLLLGWALFDLFPNQLVQALLRSSPAWCSLPAQQPLYPGNGGDHPAGAVLLQSGGQWLRLFIPRLVDTLLGSLIAGLAVLLILPDWQAGASIVCWPMP